MLKARCLAPLHPHSAISRTVSYSLPMCRSRLYENLPSAFLTLSSTGLVHPDKPRVLACCVIGPWPPHKSPFPTSIYFCTLSLFP